MKGTGFSPYIKQPLKVKGLQPLRDSDLKLIRYPIPSQRSKGIPPAFIIECGA
jgi:hypothetical protein